MYSKPGPHGIKRAICFLANCLGIIFTVRGHCIHPIIGKLENHKYLTPSVVLWSPPAVIRCWCPLIMGESVRPMCDSAEKKNHALIIFVYLQRIFKSTANLKFTHEIHVITFRVTK